MLLFSVEEILIARGLEYSQIPFYVLVGWNRVHEPQKEDGKAKLEISGCIHHITMLWDSMENQLNSSAKKIARISTLSILQGIQKDLEEKNIQPEYLEDRIIFMSKFTDILWKSDDQNCISNAENVKNYAKKFLPRHWTFVGPGSKKRWFGDSRSTRTVGLHSQQNGTAIERNWSSLSSPVPVL